METTYKITLFNKRVYKEIELSSERNAIAIGTDRSCDVRFNPEAFSGDFKLMVRRTNNGWQLRCGENIYISDSGAMKYVSKGLEHGDTFSVRYQNNNQEILSLTFTLSFETENFDYNRKIDISGKNSISFGASQTCDVVLTDELMEPYEFSLQNENGTWIVADNGSKYGVFVNGQRIMRSQPISDYMFFSVLGYSFYLKDNFIYYDCALKLQLNNNLHGEPLHRIGSCLEYPKFNRNTRLKYVVSQEGIPVLDPDKKPEKPKSNFLMSLLPSLMSIFLIIFVRGGALSGQGGFLENLSGNSYILFSVCTMGVGIITSIISLINGKKDYRETVRKRETVYMKYIERKGKEIDEIRHQEKDLLGDIYVSVEDELEQVREFSGDLFDRTVEDEDFLHVRLGVGNLPALRQIDYKKQERIETTDFLLNKPEDLHNEFKNLDNVPVVSKFAQLNSVGVVGDDELLYRIMKNMIIDLCVRHYYNDVKLFFILSEEDANRFYWARWFKNIHNESLGIRNIVCDDESKNNLFEYLYVELSRRESSKTTYPHVVVMVFDDVGIKLHPLSKYIEKANSLGFTFVFFENFKELLPQGCQDIVILNPDGMSGRVFPSSDVNSGVDFTYSTISDEDALFIAQRLAPVYCEEVGLESSLTKNITLFKLLGIHSAEDLDLTSRWNSSQVFKTMAAPLGVMRKNEVVSLDLHEKFHGPHGLVAGTTGSGKSEILQSYVLSMATLFHPYEVSFVMIDFKGGGMVNQFKNLPHLIGAITNIDGAEINRSLLSIKAELLKRQSLFAEMDVNHIDQYIKKYKANEAKVPLPHLIIIVDEFAELKADQPEFMKELISAARIGRSLGVHLILATQKPAGQVNEQIWSNSKFKLCLKVQTKEDSNEVLKSPLAAEIKEPGRAYLQVGNNEIFELFQSAYSGAPAVVSDEGLKNEFKICAVDFSGAKKVIYEHKNKKSEKESETQLQAIVNYVEAYCESQSIEKLPSICLPPLEEIIDADKASAMDDEFVNSKVPIGIYDDPAHQYQGEIHLDLAEENVMVIGSSRCGKTNFLQLIIRSLASRFSPEEVNIYILDFASMVLKNFEKLNHVGGVVCASDDEKLKNFFKLINSEIASRKKKLVEVGVSSFGAYREAGYTELPHIVIMVDNLTALKEMYLQDEDPLLTIAREGLSVGISLVVSNAQTTGIGYKYLANFSSRVALYCNDSSEYSNLFESCRMRPKNVPGRCIISYQKELYECQTYRAFVGEKEIDRVTEMRAFIDECNNIFPDLMARKIPEIPEVLTTEFVATQLPLIAKQRDLIFAGLDYSSVEPVLFDVNTMGVLGVCGRAKSGKSNFVNHIVDSIKEKNPSSKIYVIDDITRKYSSYDGRCEKYTIDASAVEGILTEWETELSGRYNLLMDRKSNALDNAGMLVLVINNQDVAAAIAANSGLLAKYKTITGKYKNLKMCIIYANLANENIQYGSPEPIKMIKENRNLVLFDDLVNFKPFEINYTIMKANKKPIEKGDGYWIKGNDVYKIKTPLRAKNR